jgi:hypothetical protein
MSPIEQEMRRRRILPAQRTAHSDHTEEVADGKVWCSSLDGHPRLRA